ncbi:MAG: hypothetical protein V9F00_13895 [Nocardioides sp.]
MQQEKKNGGWTKGKETTLDAFLKSSREEWTAVDRQLAELIRQERWQTLTLELADALRVLAGSDQFTLDREPCELEARPLEIVVREVEGGLSLSTSATDLVAAHAEDSQAILVDAKLGAFVMLPEQHRAIYFSGPPHSSDICSHLSRQTGIIPLEKKAGAAKRTGTAAVLHGSESSGIHRWQRCAIRRTNDACSAAASQRHAGCHDSGTRSEPDAAIAGRRSGPNS